MGKVGKPSKYESHVLPRLEAIKSWSRAGVDKKTVAKNLGVAYSTFAEYQIKYPELAEALKTSRDEADAQVESALMRSALGYEYEETKKIYDPGPDGQPDKKKYRVEITTKRQPPNVAACIFWLKNRKSDKWRDRFGMDHGGPDGQPLPVGTVIFSVPEPGFVTPNAQLADDTGA